MHENQRDGWWSGRRLAVVGVGVVAALIAAGCGDGGGDAEATATTETTAAPAATTTTTAPTTTTTEPPGFGEAWTTIDEGWWDFTEIDQVEVTVVDGRVLALADAQLLELDLDELTWRPVEDLAASGILPIELGDDGEPLPSRGQVAGSAGVVVVAESTPVTSAVTAEGANFEWWFGVEDGGGWRRLGPEDTGVDQRLIGPEPRFRFQQVVDTVASDGHVHVVGRGQWWRPFSTSGVEFTVVTRRPDGTWTTWASPDPDVYSGPAAAATDGASTVVLAGAPREAAGLHTWRSTDNGTTWEFTVEPAVPDDVRTTRVSAIAHGPAGWVVVAHEDLTTDGVTTSGSRSVSWTSADALTWSRHAIDQPGDEPGKPLALTVAADRYVRRDNGGVELWESVDGIIWTPLAEQVGAVELVGVGDRLIAIDYLSTSITPPLP